jgi:hypothetical protein
MPAATDTSELLISLPDVALLAHVQRPVVSMWRRRWAPSGAPFPRPILVDGGRELFDAAAVAEWLESTGRGNNRDVGADLAAFAALRDAPLREPAVLAGLTALLCLITITGRLPEDGDELLDLADENDPDDEFLYAELAALSDRLVPLARYATLLASAAYSPSGAFEKLMAERFRLSIDGHTQTNITQPVRNLIVQVAMALGTQAELGDVVFVDPTAGGSDLIIELARSVGDNLGSVVVATPDSDAPAARLLRRRLRVHDIFRERLRHDGQGGYVFPPRSVIVAQLPPADQPTMSEVDLLRAVDEIALSCTQGQRVVVLGPARALTDRSPLDGEITRVRRDLLKTGLVRAIVRLPPGLATAHGRQRLALWCLGPGSDADPGGLTYGVRTLVADLANEPLDRPTVDALVADIVAGMDGRWGIAAHTLQLCQPVATSMLQLSDDDLVAPVVAPAPAEPTAEIVDRLQALSDALRSPAPLVLPPQAVPRRASNQPKGTTVATALHDRSLTVLPGLRLDDQDLTSGTSGVRVIGPEDIVNPGPSSRMIDALVLAARYPTSRITEPGDVAFCTAPRPAAWVDRHGGSVVAFPAKVLRCKDSRLVPAVVAADINAQADSARAWRAWPLRYVPDDQTAVLARATDDLARHRTILLDRIDTLDQLTATLINGTTGGSLDLNQVEGH